MILQRALGWIGVSAAAAIGATFAVWANEPYPLTIVERNVLTPEVKPGEPVKIEIVVDRVKRCDQEITRYVQNPDGGRDNYDFSRPRSFGRIGRDVYVIEIPTDPDRMFGPAEVVTVSAAVCNPWQRIFQPVRSGDPTVDRFKYAEATKRIKGKYDGQYTR